MEIRGFFLAEAKIGVALLSSMGAITVGPVEYSLSVVENGNNKRPITVFFLSFRFFFLFRRFC